MNPFMDSLGRVAVRIWVMRTGITFELNAADRVLLDSICADRNRPQKHIWPARIALLFAEGVGTNEIRRQTGTSNTCVWRWQERFMSEGVDGLLRGKTRPERLAP
jgi:Homeodomain-like domain